MKVTARRIIPIPPQVVPPAIYAIEWDCPHCGHHHQLALRRYDVMEVEP